MSDANADSNAPEDRLRELLAALEQGSLANDGALRRELNELLRNDPDARDTYLDHVEMRALLRARLSAPLEPAEGIEGIPARDGTVEDFKPYPSGRPSLTRRIARRAISFFARPTALSLTVAALAIAVLVTALAFIAVPMHRRFASPRPAEREYVARITATRKAVWDPTTAPLSDGSRLWVGRRLRLLSGHAEIAFDRGGRVIVQGPAELQMLSAGAISLESGAATVRLEADGGRFQVQTPLVAVTDLGTEFAVAVGELGVTDVMVYEGKVELTDPTGRAAERHVLVANQSAQIIERFQVARTDPNDLPQFARAIPPPEILYATGFESPRFQVGPLHNQQGWQADGAANVQAHAAAQGHVLMIADKSNRQAYRLLPAAVGSKAAAVLFLRFKPSGETFNHCMGLSDQASPSRFDHYVAQTAIYSSAGGIRLAARDRGRFVTVADDLPLERWYRLWLVVNNLTDRYDVYLSGGPYSEPTRVGSALRFRRNVPGVLQSIYFRTGGPESIDEVAYDDLHVFSADEIWDPLEEREAGTSP